MSTSYDIDLDRNAANFQPLTPLTFLARAAEVYPDATAIIHGARSWNYRAVLRAREAARFGARRGAASSAATPSRSCSPTRRR